MKTALELCREAFPDFDDLPACIEEAHAEGLITCTAYRNDACPCFMVAGKVGPEGLALWVDFKDPAKRAAEVREDNPNAPRFHVFAINDADFGRGEKYAGDDAKAALACLLLPDVKATSADKIPEVIERIALRFCVGMVDHIGWDKMREVARLNRGETDPHACHTHDFVDANVVMAEAFTGVTGREILDAVQAQYAPGTPYEHDDRIWSASWKLARQMIQKRFPAV